MTLEDILELIKSSAIKDSKLYFVTRGIKPGVAKRSRLRDKYLFKVYQIDCNKEVQEALYFTSISQIEKIINKNFEMVDYDVLSDETEHLFTYPIQNKVFSFSDVVTNQLQKVTEKLQALQTLLQMKKNCGHIVLNFIVSIQIKRFLPSVKFYQVRLVLTKKPKVG